MKININNLTKSYKDKQVLNIDSLAINKAIITGVIGANGSGKSTLMRIMGGLDKDYQGAFLVNDKSYNEELQRNITLVFQKPYLINTDVYNNLAYPLKIRGYNKADIEDKVERVIKLLQLESIMYQRASTLSGGELQKTALARAIVFEPKLLLLDEPTANIDPQSILVMENAIRHINESIGTTVVLVTHNIRQLQRLCREAVFMRLGRVEQQGLVDTLLSDKETLGGFAAQEFLL